MPGRDADALVVGGGIGGLTAGALLARSGVNVAVVEAETRAGGYAASIERTATASIERCTWSVAAIRTARSAPAYRVRSGPVRPCR